MSVVKIEEGIYMIWNASNGECLDLSNGKWDYGQVQTWESPNESREQLYNKRWLIAKVPGGGDYYQIINSHAGVLAGGFKGERFGNWLVKAGPISTDGAATRWKAVDAGDGLVRFVWAMDEGRCLDIEGGKSHGSALIWQIGTSSRNQMWRLQRDDGMDSRSNAFSGWMRNVPDDTRLSMMNIPGTHQSLALRTATLNGVQFSDNPRCQTRPPYEQLCEGIRYLDLRFDRWMGWDEQPNLFARHGIANMGFSLAAVLQSLKIFLQRFPSETVFINASNETGTDGFQESWQNDYKFFKDTFFTNGSDQRPRMADLTLGQVRGKVICTNDGLIWNWGPPWQGE